MDSPHAAREAAARVKAKNIPAHLEEQAVRGLIRQRLLLVSEEPLRQLCRPPDPAAESSPLPAAGGRRAGGNQRLFVPVFSQLLHLWLHLRLLGLGTVGAVS